MKKWKITRWICAVMAAAILLSSGLTAGATESSTDSEEMSEAKEDLSNAKDEIGDIKAERKTAQQRLNSLKKDKANLEAYIKKLDDNLLEVQETIDRLTESMIGKQAEIEAAQADLAEAQQTEAEQYEAMKMRIQFMYEAGDVQYLELLFGSESLSDFFNRAEYISGMVEYDRDMLTAYQTTCQEIADAEVALEKEYAELEELKAVNEESKADLEILMKEKDKELKSFTDKINKASQEVNSYTKALKEQEDLIAKIEAEIKRQEEEAKREEEENNKPGGGDSDKVTTSDLQWPIPDSSRITSKFGPRKPPVAGASNFHKGVDMGAPTGTKIYAAASGTVVISKYNYSAGNYIMINHGDGLYTVYMHCSKLLVKVGDKVKQGDNIGLVGSTGYSTGPHLHFGVRIDGVYKDPLKFVSPP